MGTKEGGWGWLVTFASFWVHVIVCGIGYSSGILHQFYLTYYQKSHFETSWIVALLLSLTILAGIPSLLFTYQIGHRWTVILGGSVAAAGFILSRFINHLYEVYLCLGGLVGIGFGLALTPSVIIIESYFYKKKSFASSLATSGISVGIFAFPVMLYKLEEHLAWKGMALVLSAICLNIILAGVVMKPKSATGTASSRREYVTMFKPYLLKSAAFDIILVSNVLWSFGMAIIYTYLPIYMMDIEDVEFLDAAMLIAVSGVSGFMSRTVFIIFNQSAKLDHCSTFLCTVVLTGIMTALFPELFKHKAGAIGYVIILGLHTGYWSTFVGSVTEELIGTDYAGYSKGYIILSIGLGLLGGPPLAGWIYDETENWKICFYLAGSCLLLSSALMMGLNMKRCYYRPSMSDWTDSETESNISSLVGKAGSSTAGDDEQLIIDATMSTV